MKQRLILFLMILSMTLGALTMEQGDLRVVVDDNTGGFQLYGRLSPESNWFPLLVESNTSSYLELSLNGKKAILNGNRDYDIRLEQKENELIIIFDGSLVRVEDHITFMEPKGGIPYLILRTEIINTHNDTAELGLKRVLDTVFITDNSHFIIDGKSINRETLYREGSIPDLVLSQGEELGETLYVAPLNSEFNLPSRLLAANWNRIDRKDWDYVPPADTNFNSLPFSINDSALAFFWDLGTLSAGETTETILAMGRQNFTQQTESEPVVMAEKKESPLPTQTPVKKKLSLLHVEEQLEYLNIIINDIDRLLKKGQDVTNDEVLTLDSRLEILEQKKRDYEELQ
jgi:hypothetical protein